MRKLFLFAMLLATLFATIALPIPTYAADCSGLGGYHPGSGSAPSFIAACTEVHASVRGYDCGALPQADGGGIGLATARQAAERTARIACAAEASHALYGEVYQGVFASDGGDAFTIRPDEVHVTR